MIRRLLPIAGAVALLAAGCSSEPAPDPSAPAAPVGSVSISTTEPAQLLLPAMAAESGSGDVVDAMWTGLVDYDPVTAQPRLAQAASIETTDNLVWKITLKPGWTFHDGTPVTAASYVDAWNWAAACQNKATNQSFFGPSGANIAGFEQTAGSVSASGDITCPDQPVPLTGLAVTGELTFTMTLAQPVAILESILGYWAFSPMPQSFFKDPEVFAAAPVGNGPFQFVARTPGTDITMKAASGYQGSDRPQVETIQWRVYDDLDKAYEDLRSARLDILTRMPTDVLAGDRWQAELGEGNFLLKPAGLFTSLTFPLYDKRFAAPELRAALSRAVDRAAIVSEVWHDTVVPADAWAPPVVEGYEPGACGDTCVYDAAAAKDLFARGGGFTGDLDIAYNADGGHAEWVQAVCDSITNTLGITCVPQPFPTQKEFVQAISDKKMVGLFRTTWRMDYPNLQNFLEPLYGRTGANEGGYHDPRFDALMAEARQLPAAEAIAKYQESQTILSGTVPAIPLWSGTVQMGWSKKVLPGLVITPFATVDLASVRVATTGVEQSEAPTESASATPTPSDVPSGSVSPSGPVESVPASESATVLPIPSVSAGA
ncbi:MAG: ABC transporter substrate-binding protein [Candidatus Nanopelagicales bacterium]